jgi:hypothetical protein
MRALLAGDESALRRDLDGAVARLEAAHGSAVAALRALDSAWDESAPENGAALARLHDRFAYLKRWRSQIREAQFALAD